MPENFVLITGGTGYIGSHAVVAFEQSGYKTVIVDNLSNSSIDTLDGIEKILGYKPDFYNIDLRDKEKLKEVFLKYNFGSVLHLSGFKSVSESCIKPLEYYDNNLVGSLKLFELMQEFRVNKIIFSSTATVYNLDNKLPYNETQRTGNTFSVYSQIKYTIENILKDLSKFSGFKVLSLRYFNPIGAHESGFIGEDPIGVPNNLLPYLLKVAKGEYEYLKLFGDDYDTKDGTGVRDYIDINDLVGGHLRAYEKLNNIGDAEFYENYNLGKGNGVSVLELISITEDVTGKKINYKNVGRRQGDIAEIYCNPSKAQEELGWEAKTSLEKSIESSWKFNNL